MQAFVTLCLGAPLFFVNSRHLFAAVIPPNLPAGYTYQIAFVTHDAIYATSTDIADYNAFVTAQALPLDAYLPAGVTWHAIVSTDTVNANVNAPYVPGAYIYNTLGQIVANGNFGLYQSQIEAPIAGTQHGPQGEYYLGGAWTGSDYLGNAIPGAAAGDAMVAYGSTAVATSNWAYDGTFAAATGFFSIYGISSPIVVPLYADVNGDQIVNGQDIALASASWLASGTNPADINLDHIVNGQDIALISANWLQQGYRPSANAAAVPEPASALLLAAGVTAALLYRRRAVR